MAEIKKTAIVKPVAKAVVAKAADTKTAEVKTTPVAPVAKAEPVEEKKAEEKKAPAKKETAKKTTAKKAAEKKAPVKKETVKKAAPAKKAAVKETLHVQFSGKTYTTEDLVKIAKDVWKYDLNKDENDFKTVELYVKPEESAVYYVINDDVKGAINWDGLSGLVAFSFCLVISYFFHNFFYQIC